MYEILKSHPNFEFEDHIKGVLNYSLKNIKKLNLNLEEISKEDLEQILKLIVLSHDFGKCTSYFQDYIRKRNVEDVRLKSHSLISSFFCFELINSYFNFKDDFFSYLGAFVVKKHHGNLDDLSKVLCINKKKKKVLLKQLEDIKKNLKVKEVYLELFKNFNFNFDEILENMFNRIKNSVDSSDCKINKIIIKQKNPLELFFIIELLYSLLLDADKKHASGILDNYQENNLNLDENLVEKYIKKQNFENSKINKLKDEFFKECTQNSNLNKENKIYSITAPTGIGKTFTSFATALKLRNKLGQSYKIHYILPFTSVIDQNYEELYNILEQKEDFKRYENDYILKHHYLTEYEILKKKKNLDEQNLDYRKDSYSNNLLIVKSWDSQVVVSTYVQLLHTIIGGDKNFMNKFHNICNSIIILDEVQCIAIKYWDLTRKIFKLLSEKFGIYFIFLTATQPLIFKKNEIIELGNPDRFFEDKEFDRVSINDCLSRDFEIDDFYDEFKLKFKQNKANRYLFILNTKKSSFDLFSNFEKDKDEFEDYELIYLSTNLTPNDRKKQIKKITGKRKKGTQEWEIKPLKKYIVVTTQLIEAGVDISSDVCYRDFAPIDSIIQSAGRCNRYNELKKYNKKGEVNIIRLFEYKDDKKRYFSNFIYDNNLRIPTQNVLKKLNENNILELTDDYFEALKDLEHCEDLERDVINVFNFDFILNGNNQGKYKFEFIESYPKQKIFILNQDSRKDFDNYLKILRKYSRGEFERGSKEEWSIKAKLKKFRKRLEMFSIDVSFKNFDNINYLFENDYSNDFFKCLNLFDLKEEDESKKVYNFKVGLNLNYDAFGGF